MNVHDVMAELERLGSEQTRKTWRNHGCTAPMFGVKVGDLKTIVKKVKVDTPLARALWATGNSDARYLAGLIGRGGELSAEELTTWADQASWTMLSEYTVPWLACEHPQGFALASRWIDSPQEHVSAAGWATLSCLVNVLPDDALDLQALGALLDRVAASLATAPNRTRYAMNGFVISVGGSVKPLTDKAIATARATGRVQVDMGDTACKVPDAVSYIEKIIQAGRHGKKRATARC